MYEKPMGNKNTQSWAISLSNYQRNRRNTARKIEERNGAQVVDVYPFVIFPPLYSQLGFSSKKQVNRPDTNIKRQVL
jgi:hypothetical protein